MSSLLQNRSNLTFILSWLQLGELALTLTICKEFAFIRSSEWLSQHWLLFWLRRYSSESAAIRNSVSMPISFIYKMRIFLKTRCFRIFSRIFPYQHHSSTCEIDLNEYNWAVNVHHSKYANLFKYDGSVLGSEATLFKLCTTVSTQHSLSLGQKTIVNLQQFSERFEKYFHFSQWKDAINWRIYNIAGGSIVKCLMAHEYDQHLGQDIDLFMSLQTEVFGFHCSDQTSYADNLNKTSAEMFANDMAVFYDVKYFISDKIQNVFVCFSEQTQTDLSDPIMSSWPERDISDPIMLHNFKKNKNYVQFQFIAPLYLIPKDFNHDLIISNFDIDICQVRFDGHDIYATFAFIFAVSSMNFLSYPVNSKMTENWKVPQLESAEWYQSMFRALKYCNRGFNLLVPDAINMVEIIYLYHNERCSKKWNINTRSIVPSNYYMSTNNDADDIFLKLSSWLMTRIPHS